MRLEVLLSPGDWQSRVDNPYGDSALSDCHVFGRNVMKMERPSRADKLSPLLPQYELTCFGLEGVLKVCVDGLR